MILFSIIYFHVSEIVTKLSFTFGSASFHQMHTTCTFIRSFLRVYIITVVIFFILVAELFKAVLIPFTNIMPSKKEKINVKLPKAKSSPYTMPLVPPRNTSPERRKLRRTETTLSRTSGGKRLSSVTRQGDSLPGVGTTSKVSPYSIRDRSPYLSRKQGISKEVAKPSVRGSTRVSPERKSQLNLQRGTRNGDKNYKSQAHNSSYQGTVRQRSKRISVSDFPQTPVSKKRSTGSYKQMSPAAIKQQEEERRIRALKREEQKRHNDMLAFAGEQCELQELNGAKVHLAGTHVSYEDTGSRIRAVEVATSDMNAEHKVLLVVGGTGSGKSTMINALFNYIVGIDWKDDFRLKLVEDAGQGQRPNQAFSQTNWITAYTIYAQPFFRIKITLTIVDTPGFCDTSGIKRDREIMDQMKEFFTASPDMRIHGLDAVGFVVQSSLPRLTAHQIHSFECILSLFGHDLTNNIFMLLTFADGQKPQVLSGIQEARLPYTSCFKFNNSALYAKKGVSDVYGIDDDDDEDDDFDEMFWRMTYSSLKAFTTELCNVQPTSLYLTRNVLNDRSELENTVQKLQRKIRRGLNKLEQLESKEKNLQMIKYDVRKNKNYTYRVKEETTETEPTEPGQYTSNCTRCNITCCDDCPYNDNDDKRRCCVMRNGRCTVCPQRCVWWRHENQPYVYVVSTQYVWKTSYKMKRKFKEAERKKQNVQREVDELQNDFRKIQMATERLTRDARETYYNLEEIALCPKLTNETAYIDLLIRNEQSSFDSGRQLRITELTELKKQTQLLDELLEDDFDPFENYS